MASPDFRGWGYILKQVSGASVGPQRDPGAQSLVGVWGRNPPESEGIRGKEAKTGTLKPTNSGKPYNWKYRPTI